MKIVDFDNEFKKEFPTNDAPKKKKKLGSLSWPFGK